MLKINILAENHVHKRGISAEHGYSVLVEVDDFRVLFDAGQSELLFLNAEKSDIEISNINALVISHGHYDHTGGVPEFFGSNLNAPMYIHPQAFFDRYLKADSLPSSANIGIPWSGKKDVFNDRIILVKKPYRIHERIYLSGEVPRTVSFEEAPQNFLIRSSNGDLVNDTVIDEQFMVVKGANGIYVFVGCSHPGVINCINYAAKLFPGEKLAGLIGGMHLANAKESRIQETIKHLIESGVDTIIPLHCSGIIPETEIKRIMGEKCILLACGDQFVFEE